MKEDLIVIPELDVFQNLIADAKSDLTDLQVEDEELKDRQELALDVVNILEKMIHGKKDLKNAPLSEKISYAAHLYFLEMILEDLFEEDDDTFMFDEDEEEYEDADEEEHKN